MIMNVFTGEELTLQWFVDALRDILAKIFNFIGEEDGWTAEVTE